jgi:hypothetical protein
LPKLLHSLRILRESPAKLSFEEFRRAHRQLVRNPLLQYLQRRRGRTSLWFAEQEVHGSGITHARLGFVPTPGQKRHAHKVFPRVATAVTTESDEVQIVVTVVELQPVQDPRTFYAPPPINRPRNKPVRRPNPADDDWKISNGR